MLHSSRPAIIFSAISCTAVALLLCVRPARALAQSPTQPKWWLARGLRVLTYEFLERKYRQTDLTAQEILSCIDRVGGCDLVLIKGFHYYQGKFDDSSWGYPRFRAAAEALIPKLHARGIKAGIFGFMDRRRSYRGGPDHARIMETWREYVRLGADILFVDEESGASGVELRAPCLRHCDELRATFDRPVGLFLYGKASQADRVRDAAQHVDAVGEMGYELYLQGHGDYRLADLTRRWSDAAKSVPGHLVAYWTGALVFGGEAADRSDKSPGTAYWRDRFGERTLAAYFADYLREALASGADGVFIHSICRMCGLSSRSQADSVSAIRTLFAETHRLRQATPGRQP